LDELGMWFSVRKSRVKMERPALIVALSTSVPQYRALYSQARELASYMMRKMEFRSVCSIHSSSLPPEVLVREEGVASLPSCSFYLHRGERDILLLAGDSSPMDDQYDFARLVLGYAKEVGVEEVYSVGARWTEPPITSYQEAELNGFATDGEGLKRLEANGVKVVKNEPAPFFASLVVGLAPSFGMRGYKISVDHGEPAPHTRTVIKMLQVLSKMIGFSIDLGELEELATPKPKAKGSDGGSIYH
jgi:proteasome assembly chaperone (PAC2) family protein